MLWTPRDPDTHASTLARWTALTMLPMRLVVGWIFVAAAHRRLILAPAKHDMASPAWLGHKINTFMPHASGPFQPMLELFSREPELMNAFTWVFTGTELLVGVALLLGVASRLTGIVTLSLGVGLMHTSGWLGPTCLSEWHTASLLVLTSVMLTVQGSGSLSLDAWLGRRFPTLHRNRWWQRATRPADPSAPPSSKVIVGLATAVLLYVAGMNQLLHGGVWGPLHNDSVRPHLELEALAVGGGTASFSVYRDAGPETTGAFVVEARLLDAERNVVERWRVDDFAAATFENVYVNAVHVGAHAMVVPLGGKAIVRLPSTAPAGDYSLELEEVGGLVFSVGPT